MSVDIVHRLHRRIAQALDETRPGWAGAPITVAEIYQELAPYRLVRGELGIELNADYEFALLRLLAGQDGLARLEPEEARQELAREIESPNPNVGLFRRCAACDVWIQPVQDSGGAMQAAPAPAELLPQAPAGGRAEPLESAPVSPFTAPAPAHAAVPAPATAGTAIACAHCAAPLPAGREVRFCPSCGGDQKSRPCPNCGEKAERDWRYCVACGSQLASSTVA